MQGVNVGIKLLRVDVGSKRIEKVVARSRHLALVEPAAVNEVLPGLGKNHELHLVDSRICCFASPQSTNWEGPSRTRFSRSCRT